MPPELSHYYVVCPQEQKLVVLRALVRRELGSGTQEGSPGSGRSETRALVFASGSRPLEDIAGSLDAALGGTSRQDRECGREPAGPPVAECLREELGLNRRVSVGGAGVLAVPLVAVDR